MSFSASSKHKYWNVVIEYVRRHSTVYDSRIVKTPYYAKTSVESRRKESQNTNKWRERESHNARARVAE